MSYKSIGGVSRVPLNEQVYRSLLASITQGSIPPGTELREQHLAKQMNVSATPVREAIRRLASDGLVEIIPYHGAVVRTLDQEEISQAYACREALERLAIAECIRHVNDKDIQALYELMEDYQSAESFAEICDYSQQFDSYLYNLCGNRILHGLLDTLKGIIARDRKYSSANVDRRHEIYLEHKAIIQALESKDVEAAQAAVSIHIHNGRRFIESKG